MRVYWIEYKGYKILYEDYSNIDGDDLLNVLYEVEEIFKKQEIPILCLMNYTNTVLSSKFINEVKKIGKKYLHLIKKTAVIGASKEQVIISHLEFDYKIKINSHFDNIIDAKDYLINDNKV
jgi:hypothetical protein